MTSSFCAACGSSLAAGSRFCPSCGAPVVAAPAPAAGPGPAPAGAAPPAGATAMPRPLRQSSDGPTAPQSTASQSTTSQSTTSQSSGADRDGGAQPPSTPFADQGRGPRRSPLDDLLNGDWGGALLAAGVALLVMLAVSFLGVLSVTGADVGARPLVVSTGLLTLSALGGDLLGASDGGLAAGSFRLGILPLTLTVLGLTVLTLLYLRAARRQGSAGRSELALHAVRTVLVFTALVFVLSLVARFRADGGDAALDFLQGRISADILASVLGAFLLSTTALTFGVLLYRRDALPAALRTWRDRLVPAFTAAVTVLGVGVLVTALLAAYELATGTDRAQQLGVSLLFLPNVAWSLVLLMLGVPLRLDGSPQGLAGLGADSGGATDTAVTLLTLTEDSAWVWLGFLLTVATILATAVVLALRQPTVAAARREGLRFAAAFAVTAFMTALLLRITGEASGALVTDVTGDYAVRFAALLAALAAGLWGLVAGVAAPAIGMRLPPGLALWIRRRFGAVHGEAGASPGGYAGPTPGSAPPPSDSGGQPTRGPEGRGDQPEDGPGHPRAGV